MDADPTPLMQPKRLPRERQINQYFGVLRCNILKLRLLAPEERRDFQALVHRFLPRCSNRRSLRRKRRIGPLRFGIRRRGAAAAPDAGHDVEQAARRTRRDGRA